METLSARHSSHHDCPFISFELSMGQMVKWVDRRQRREQWAQVKCQCCSEPAELFWFSLNHQRKQEAFVKDRLAAAALEIFQVFEKTIEKYEEEASSSKQEIERLRGLLLEFESNHKQDLSQSSTPPGQHHCQREEPGLSTDQRDQDPRPIKEEDQELWLSQQQEVEPVQVFKDTNDLNLLQSSVWEKPKQESLQHQSENSECEEQFQEDKTVEFNCKIQHFASPPSSQPQIQNERMQYGRENERPAASVTLNQTQTDQKPAELSQVSSVAPDYQCNLCAKSFSLSHHLLNHAYCMHSKDTGLLCAVCGKTLESIESLNVHLKSHRGPRGCHLCGKQCSSTTALSEHMASHSGVKLHRCHVCGKECRRKADLKIHLRIHTGEKPFCCSYCSKSFTHSGHLRKHMRSHTGERPHRCDVCGKGFLQKTHLKYHLGTHTEKY